MPAALKGVNMIRNSQEQWGWPAKLLHWVGAIIILLLLGHGWWMTHFAPRPERLAHYAGHAALGYDFLALLIIRLLWRWANPVPVLPSGLQPWEVWGAHLSHSALYVLMLVTTLLGWALVGTMRTPLQQDVFGLKVPLIYVSQDRFMHGLLEDSHKITAYLLAALVLVHAVAALRHHFVKRNTVLRRMIVGAKT
jgi:cytochrome b561